MRDDEFLKSQIAIYCWREASEWGELPMLTVACCLFNRVRAGQGDWHTVLELAPKTSFRLEQPLRDKYPDPRDPAWRRFFSKIDAIYEGQHQDLTASDVLWAPTGTVQRGLYWGDLAGITNQWFLEKIVRSPDHKKVCFCAPLHIYN